RLARLGLVPADLREPTDMATALRWTGRRLPLIAAGVLALPGLLLVTGPMLLADLLTRRGSAGQESRASRHLYIGSAIVLLWWGLLAGAAGVLLGPGFAAAAALVLPGVGFLGLAVQQAWGVRLAQARRWLFLRFGGRRRRSLLAEQASLGAALEDIVARPPAGADPLPVPSR
ncbi:MAG TPA: hypothetical protein VFT84_03420, partial [Gemmatimonadales bacterium]|nr:hypothetical protein [Gemmatimonadales bacterium]